MTTDSQDCMTQDYFFRKLYFCVTPLFRGIATDFRVLTYFVTYGILHIQYAYH